MDFGISSYLNEKEDCGSSMIKILPPADPIKISGKEQDRFRVYLISVMSPSKIKTYFEGRVKYDKDELAVVVEVRPHGRQDTMFLKALLEEGFVYDYQKDCCKEYYDFVIPISSLDKFLGLLNEFCPFDSIFELFRGIARFFKLDPFTEEEKKEILDLIKKYNLSVFCYCLYENKYYLSFERFLRHLIKEKEYVSEDAAKEFDKVIKMFESKGIKPDEFREECDY